LNLGLYRERLFDRWTAIKTKTITAWRITMDYGGKEQVRKGLTNE
jgi:hypothetical protein